MSTQLDLDDVAAQSPLALSELAALRADAQRLRELLSECSIALLWPGRPPQQFSDRISSELDRIDAMVAQKDKND